MKKGLRISFSLVSLIAFIMIAILWTPDSNKADMIEKYSSPASRFIKAEPGLNLHVRDQGLRAGPAIVLIHGGNSSLHVWEKMVENLGDTFRLISLDLPGHGITGAHPSRGYSPDAMADAIETVMDELQIDKAIWAGNSMGGWIAWRAALSRPERVSGLILIDASGAITGEPIKPYLAARIAGSPAGKILVPNVTPKFIVRASLKQVISNDENVTEALLERHWELARFPGNRDAMLDMQTLNREDGKWNDIQNIHVPTLILWGKDDVTIPLSFANAFHSKIKNSVLKVHPNAAHVPMEEIPAQLSKDIKDWYLAAFE